MKPNKVGQVAKFHTPLPGENPHLRYVVLQVIDDVEKPRADIRALNVGGAFIPINTVLLEDLEVVEVETSELIGQQVTINLTDSSKAAGKVIGVNADKIIPDFTLSKDGIKSNIMMTVIDQNGHTQIGTLFIN